MEEKPHLGYLRGPSKNSATNFLFAFSRLVGLHDASYIIVVAGRKKTASYDWSRLNNDHLLNLTKRLYHKT